MDNSVPRIELAPGYSISKILKGGWQLAGGHGPIDRKSAIEDMPIFVQTGITTFDFGDIYTGVEELIGEFIRQHGAKDVQLHTKYVPDLDTLPSVDRPYTERVIDRSLSRLGIDTLDLVQFHWWDYSVPRYIDVAQHLVDLQRSGKIRNIGVTNFDVPRLKELVEAGIPIVTNQVQYSVLDQRPEHGMVEFCQQQGIKLLCYGTVAGGFLSERYLGVPEPREPLENRSLTKYKLIVDDFGGWELFQEMLTTLAIVAKKHRVSMTNVATRFVLDKPQVAGIIIGARNTNHLEDNLRVFDFDLDEEDNRLLESVIRKSPGIQGDTYALERDINDRHGRIMHYNNNNL
ncbi:aldo/keto reductase [Candidatus Daviesbacteria bacterium RIFCSPHIGHO2_02_FULL_36_13]|uniref:Aldo/keto reductase n=1 Tax=Candidatus Daviesbacteria bacterium RIFCSPHIGHO2_02_FULL_36_13 TaxID=1797768 RepID=A0A1F5JUJ5_9BACT|nr:MAG: aldo/keto reductase [Candidatus Daviesbacteria bacterium RIFCSPHIGHO2_02_FULL_36_13]